MITNIIILLWLVFIVSLVCCLVNYLKTRNNQVYSFQTLKSDIPYITIDIQGNPLNMIVDSGAGVSLITEDTLSFLEYYETEREVTLQGLVNESTPPKMVSIPINVKGKEVIEDFIRIQADDFAGFGRKYGVIIHGLLGNELFEKTGCVIDYKNHSVSFG